MLSLSINNVRHRGESESLWNVQGYFIFTFYWQLVSIFFSCSRFFHLHRIELESGAFVQSWKDASPLPPSDERDHRCRTRYGKEPREFLFPIQASEITHFSASSFVLSRRFHLDLKNVIWLLCHKYSFNEYSSCSHSIVLELMTILILMIMAMELVILMVGDGSLVPGIL